MMFDATKKVARSLKRMMGHRDGLAVEGYSRITFHLSREDVDAVNAEVDAIEDIEDIGVPLGAWAAVKELYEAVEHASSRLDYLRELWGDEGVTRSIADELRAALDKARS